MGLFSKKTRTPEYTGPPGMDPNAVDLIEGRRQCGGCFLYFRPSGGERFCSETCAAKGK